MSKFALYVPLEAKQGKDKEVADFLRSAIPLVNAEAGTISWFAIQMGPSSFAIFDTFDNEAGRNGQLPTPPLQRSENRVQRHHQVLLRLPRTRDCHMRRSLSLSWDIRQRRCAL